MRTKRWAATILVASMMVGMTGCGENKTTSGNKVTQKFSGYKLNDFESPFWGEDAGWYGMGDEELKETLQNDLANVSDVKTVNLGLLAQAMNVGSGRTNKSWGPGDSIYVPSIMKSDTTTEDGFWMIGVSPIDVSGCHEGSGGGIAISVESNDNSAYSVVIVFEQDVSMEYRKLIGNHILGKQFGEILEDLENTKYSTPFWGSDGEPWTVQLSISGIIYATRDTYVSGQRANIEYEREQLRTTLEQFIPDVDKFWSVEEREKTARASAVWQEYTGGDNSKDSKAARGTQNAIWYYQIGDGLLIKAASSASVADTVKDIDQKVIAKAVQVAKILIDQSGYIREFGRSETVVCTTNDKIEGIKVDSEMLKEQLRSNDGTLKDLTWLVGLVSGPEFNAEDFRNLGVDSGNYWEHIDDFSETTAGSKSHAEEFKYSTSDLRLKDGAINSGVPNVQYSLGATHMRDVEQHLARARAVVWTEDLGLKGNAFWKDFSSFETEWAPPADTRVSIVSGNVLSL